MANRRFLVCNCEKTMPIDGGKLAGVCEGLGDDSIHMSLCRAQLASYEKALSSGDELVVTCMQEAPLFEEVAAELGCETDIRFVNIRETAGWSKEAEKAHPKIAALISDAAFQPIPARLKTIRSDGMCLVYGAGQQALETAQALSSRLSVTLMLSDAEDVVLPPSLDIPVYRGDLVSASGSFGDFEVTVDNYAAMRPSSRETLEFGVPRNGATSNCSLIFDLSGRTPLFAGYKHRDGYAHLDPGDPVSIFREVMNFSEMVGEYEKPIYVDYNANTCAHSRSQKTGCSKCLDVCPAGAISDEGDIIAIDSGICGGCGSCHAVCPTGSISYQYPSRSDLVSRVQNLLPVYLESGGKNPVLLLHDEKHGTDLISAMARYGDGLPANVIPLGFHSSSVFGHVELLGMISSGATGIVVLADPSRQDELTGTEAEIGLATEILSGLDLSGDVPRIDLICESDPDLVAERLWNIPTWKALKPSTFQPVGGKREVAKVVFSSLHEQSATKPDRIVLPVNSPYGKVDIDKNACTLCMACTSACPANAIADTPGEPRLRFTEAACVQCGLCVSTCPENALSLVPQLDFTPGAMQPVTLYEEEPFECISCGKPFATKSTIERISAKLAGKHSMFASSAQVDLIKMCENCRVEAQANSTNDPFVAGERPKPRTTEDYLAAESGKLTADDFLIDD